MSPYVIGVLIGAGAVVLAAVVAASIVFRRLASVPDPRHPSQYDPEAVDLMQQRERDFGYERRPR